MLNSYQGNGGNELKSFKYLIVFVAVFFAGIGFCSAQAYKATTVSDLKEALQAARSKDLYTLRDMVNNGLDINYPDANGDTIYCTALKQRDSDTANILKQFGGSYKGCPGIDPAYVAPQAAAPATQAKSGIFAGIQNGTTLLIAGGLIAAGAFILSDSGGGDNGNPSSGDGNGTGPDVPPIPPANSETFNVPIGYNQSFVPGDQNDRNDTNPLYQTPSYDFVTLGTYSALDFNTDFAYNYDYLGIPGNTHPLYKSDYSMYDDIGVNWLRALGYDGTKFPRMYTKFIVQNPVNPPDASNWKYVNLAIISSSGVDITHENFTGTKWGFQNGKVYNENTGQTVILEDGKVIQGAVSGFEVKCAQTNLSTYTCFDASGNPVASYEISADSLATGLAGIIAANQIPGTWYGGMVGIAPATTITSYQVKSYTEGMADPYGLMKTALEQNNDILLFTEAASAVTVVNHNEMQNPQNLPNSEDLAQVLAQSGDINTARSYFENIVNGLYINFNGYAGTNALELYESILAITDISKRPVIIFASGDDNLSNVTNIESAAPIIYPELLGNFINVVAVDEDHYRYVAQNGTKAGGSEIWVIGSNGCGSTKNWCLSAPGKNIIAPASGGGNLTEYALTAGLFNMKAYQIISYDVGTETYTVSDEPTEYALKLKDLPNLAENYIYMTGMDEFDYKFKNSTNQDLQNAVIIGQDGNVIYFNYSLGSPELEKGYLSGNHEYNDPDGLLSKYSIGYWDATFGQYMALTGDFAYYLKEGMSGESSDYYFELTTTNPATSQLLQWVAPDENRVRGYWKDEFSLASAVSAASLSSGQKVLYWEYAPSEGQWVITNYLNNFTTQFTYSFSSTSIVYTQTTDPNIKFKYTFADNKWEQLVGGTYQEVSDFVTNPIALPSNTAGANGDPLLNFYFQIGTMFAQYSSGSTTAPTGNYGLWNDVINKFDFANDGNPFNFDFFVKGSGANDLETKLADIGDIYLGLSILATDVNNDGYLVGAVYTTDSEDGEVAGWQPWQYYHCDNESGVCGWKTWTSVSEISAAVDFDGDRTYDAGGNCTSNCNDDDFYIDFYFIDTDSDGTYGPGDLLYMPQNGSAAAAAVVAGAMSALLGAYQHMTPDQVVALLFLTADDIGAAGVDDMYGQGFINLIKATRPYGRMSIPINQKTFDWNAGHASYQNLYPTGGASTASSSLSAKERGYSLNSSYMALSSSFGDALSNTGLNFIILDDFNREYEVPFNSLVDIKPVVRDIHLMMNDFG
ncbi:MAG: hypothetical protein LBR35_01705, partial [Rickettsiales bacterium]|nr:hypothetical protein [Rickettsiales bacterium]